MTKDAGKEFMEKTYYQNLEESDQRKGLEQPPLEMDYDHTKEKIDLPAPEKMDNIPKGDIKKIIEQRRSVRKYANKSLTKEELAWLLWATQGVKQVTSRPVTLRTVPSAGARHAFETFILVIDVKGLDPGIYRYLALEHKLIPYNLDKGIIERVYEGAFDQSMVKTGAVTFIWVADVYRMKYRYGERGYRYLHIDVGHVCQNFYLAAENINCGVCAIAAFNDEVMNGLLHLDGEDHFVIYLASCGKKN
jgi:SagB-type dehydrogenase family enzyme